MQTILKRTRICVHNVDIIYSIFYIIWHSLFKFILHFFFIELTSRVLCFIHQQVTDLRPETNYVFLVRAENNHGLSLPGPLSDVVQTTNVNQHTVPQVELTRARDRLNSEILHLKEVQSLTSTSVKIMWDVSVV